MTPPRDDRVDALRDGILCPVCGYSLRGLAGRVVACPECGAECDIAKIVTRKWLGPWYQAPGVNTLARPAAVIIVLALLLANLPGLREEGWLPVTVGRATVIVVLLCLVAWGVLMRRAYRVFGDMRGIWLPLFVHALLVGYVVGVVGASCGGVYALTAVARGNAIDTLASIVACAVGTALFYACRRGERYIAEQCIREYLARETAVRPREAS